MAWRAYREDENGVPRLDIDNNIGEALSRVPGVLIRTAGIAPPYMELP